MAKRYFYPASRSHHALCMAIDHGFKFVKRGDKFWSLEGIAAIDPASSYEFVLSQDCHHLLEARVGDMISHLGMRAWRIDGMDGYAFHHPAMPNESLARFTLIADKPTIIQRNGKPFMAPEWEEA